jgi:two-component system OmpR family sensor kinase
LRTPLTVILGQLEVLAGQAQPTAAEVSRVEQLVAAEVARMARLVDDLMLLAHSEGTEFLRIESIDLPSFVAELWDGLSLTAERRFECSEVPAGSLLADSDRVAQALRNLGRNAIEHTPEGVGLVRLDVTALPPDRVRFTVTDNGTGIRAAERTRIFERFHRTDAARSRSAGGAGLGLAIVQAIVEAHGGHVAARESRTGSGARIELDLPGFSPARADVDGRSPRRRESPPGN